VADEQSAAPSTYDDAHSEERAYKAGRALLTVDWSPVEDVTTPEQRAPGVHHCPFAEGDPLRDHWLQGLKDALGETADYDPAAVLAEVNAELGGS
jgi:hypothetical protein